MIPVFSNRILELNSNTCKITFCEQATSRILSRAREILYLLMPIGTFSLSPHVSDNHYLSACTNVVYSDIISFILRQDDSTLDTVLSHVYLISTLNLLKLCQNYKVMRVDQN